MIEGTAAVSWGEDRIDLFWVGADRTLTHRSFHDGAWDEPESLGGTLASAPAATAWAADQLQVFAVFPDGALWNRYWDGASWHGWESLGGELRRRSRRIIVERRPDRRLGRRPRWHDLASLVGRDALGRLGAPPALGRGPRRVVDPFERPRHREPRDDRPIQHRIELGVRGTYPGADVHVDVGRPCPGRGRHSR